MYGNSYGFQYRLKHDEAEEALGSISMCSATDTSKCGVGGRPARLNAILATLQLGGRQPALRLKFKVTFWI
jgi:hypothetical protein